MRAAVLLLLALAACSAEPGIDCAIGGGELAPACTLERSGAEVVLRHPDGGFRRLRIENGVPLAADGAEAARVSARGDIVEVAIGRDLYRIPAEALR